MDAVAVGKPHFSRYSLQFHVSDLGSNLISCFPGLSSSLYQQVLAGLASPSEGHVTIDRQLEKEAEQGLSHGKPGIVFQFPERYGRSLEKNTSLCMCTV